MAGGGGEGQPESVDPGTFMSILTPLMRVVGYGISARGGALGPALASAGDYLEQGYKTRRQQMASDLIAQALPIARSQQITPGVPGTPEAPRFSFPGAPSSPPVTAPMLSPGADPSGDVVGRFPDAPQEAEPDVMPGTPGIPSVTREWQGTRTAPEALQWLASRSDIPPSVRALVTDRLLSMKLPTDVERPQGVQEEVDLQRKMADETRAQQQRVAEEERLAPIGAAVAPAGYDSQAYGRAVAARISPPPLPPSTRTDFTPEGRRITRDTRSGQPISDEPIRTPEDEQTRQNVRGVLIPQFEREIGAAIQAGVYKPEQVVSVRARLDYAKQTGDVKPLMEYVQHVGDVQARERAAELRRAGAGASQETVTTREETLPRAPIWRKPEMEAVTNLLPTVVQDAIPGFQVPKGPVKTPSGQTVTPQQYLAIAKQAIEQRFLDSHGVQVSVQWVPASALNPFSSGSWKILRAWEPERKKASVTERKKGPPAVAVPAD